MKKISPFIFRTIIALALCFGLVSCTYVSELTDALNINLTYRWYDSDNSLLYEESIAVGATPTNYPLPSDTEKWDYIEWRTGNTSREKVAYRVPQTSYFVGNVFQIVVMDLGEQPIATGSAFVFDNDGWFITNAHVMEDGYYAQAIFNIPNSETGESFTYLDINSGTYYHLDKDIYIGKIENYQSIQAHYKDIPIDSNYQIGEVTYSVGYPLSSTDLAIHKGKVTERWSDLYEKLYSGNSYICSSSYIAPGSSGGILTNGDLEIIGITTLGWTDSYDNFVSGASISAFNFTPLLANANDKDLVTLTDRFHEEEKAYIGYFNEAKAHESTGESEKYFFEDGTLGYIYEWDNEGESSNSVAASMTSTLLVGSDAFIVYTSNIYWESGDRRTINFYGYYDHKYGLDNFIYEFEYNFDNGKFYTVECTDINYSPTVSLTLNRCVLGECSYSYTPPESAITYAKEQFNNIYEWLTEDIGRFK